MLLRDTPRRPRREGGGDHGVVGRLVVVMCSWGASELASCVARNLGLTGREGGREGGNGI